jgi:UDP-glucose 4-epimerase
MKILLIGGSGFIGEYLTKKISAKKNCEIIVVYNSAFLKEKFTNVSYVKTDLTKPDKGLKETVNLVDAIVIMTQPNEKIIDNLIKTIKPESFLKKIIYLSTILLYDNFIGKQDESFSLNPATDYERGKFQEENKLSKFIRKNDLKLCIVRLSNVYGDIKNKGLINFIFLSLLNEKPMIINGEGGSVRDYIFIEDVVNWLDFLIFWNQKKKEEIFNICTGKGYSVKEVVNTVEKIVGKKVEKINGPAALEKKKIIGNNDKIVNISSMNPRYNLKKGLKKTRESYLAKLSNN